MNYTGNGGSVFSVWLTALLLPTMAVSLVGFLPAAGFMIAATRNSQNQPEPAFLGMAGLFYIVALVGVIFVQRWGETRSSSYWDELDDRGKRCAYHGTARGLISALIVPMLLTLCTMGLYTPRGPLPAEQLDSLAGRRQRRTVPVQRLRR
nr:DUF898 family protein [Deltaproteobacteria bacterium]